MEQQERENFYRHSTLIVDDTNEVFQGLVDLHLTNESLNLIQFIENNQHDIYHLCYNNITCCSCPTKAKKPIGSPPSRILHPSQLDILFDINKKHPNHNAHNRAKHCCCPVSTKLKRDDLDLTLARCLLVNFSNVVPDHSKERYSLEKLIKFRNNTYGHATKGTVSNKEYCDNREEIEACIMILAKTCGREEDFRQKLKDAKVRTLDETICRQLQTSLLLSAQRETDIPAVIETAVEAAFEKFQGKHESTHAGLDEALSKHIAYLFIRDPLFLCSETLDQDEILDIQHLENINSTNLQTLRLKLPICNTSTGWRVEFRPMEIQLSDFENAAYAVFVFLVTRIVIAYRLNFVIPISKVDENMSAASKRDAVLEEKFYFRRNSFSDKSITEIKITKPGQLKTKDGDDFCQMTIDEIINGNVEFPGLIPLIKTYLESKCEETDEETNYLTNSYLKLISDRASGAEPTTANFIRNFVTTHPYYQQDSIVSDIINYELLKACAKKSNGGIK